MQPNMISNSTGNIYKWSVSILSGLFMFVVLYVYRAYHIDEVEAYSGHGMLIRALTHSVIISSVFFLVEFVGARYLPINERIKPLITALIATFIGLNLSFLAFNYFYLWTELYWSSYAQFLYEYPLILIIPVTLSYLIDRISGRSEAEMDALISLMAENEKEYFQVKVKNLLFIKSADNYIEIFYLSSPGQVNKYLLRQSLKTIELLYESEPFLVRCHRSYLVNPVNINSVNKSNGRMELNIAGIEIPVSKKYAVNLAES